MKKYKNNTMNSKQVYKYKYNIQRVQLKRVQPEAVFASCVVNASLCLPHTDDQPVSVHTQVPHNIITHTHTHTHTLQVHIFQKLTCVSVSSFPNISASACPDVNTENGVSEHLHPLFHTVRFQ